MQDSLTIRKYIESKPKAELHLHIEGTLEPEMLLMLSQRNKIQLKYDSIDAIKAAYNFRNLQEFLDIYYQGMSVLCHEEDYFDLTYAYLQKAHANNVSYCEIFFDPQGHLSRGILFSTFIQGISHAIEIAKVKLGVDAKLIMSFLRHLPEEEAIKTFELAMDFRDKFIGIGLDSSECGHPPINFKRVFNLARNAGLHLVAHAGEEGPSEYIWQALDDLGVERIDHGNKAIDDEKLIERLALDQIPLTMCPLSNRALMVCPDLSNHPAKKLLNSGVCVTINSDDPAYFGGYINDNYFALVDGLKLMQDDVETLIHNSHKARF